MEFYEFSDSAKEVTITLVCLLFVHTDVVSA